MLRHHSELYRIMRNYLCLGVVGCLNLLCHIVHSSHWLSFSCVDVFCTSSEIRKPGRFGILFYNWLTRWGRVVSEKLIVTQLVKKFHAVYVIRKLITIFTRARRWALSWARCIQSTPFHSYFLKIHSIIISLPKSFQRIPQVRGPV